MKRVLGIDIGGTNLRGAIINIKGEISSKNKIKSNAKEGVESLIENLLSFIDSYSKDSPDYIGIGMPGIINQKTGVLTQAPNISDVSDYPLLQVLKKHISTTPIFLENDANCAAAGEFWIGSGKKSDSLIMMTLGTGLGGGIILNGELWRGEDGMAGEIGHIVVDPDGPLCNCGNNGCLESFVSAESIRKIVSSNPELNRRTIDTEQDQIPEKIRDLALEGNNDSIKIWNDFGRYLGIGVTSLINLLNIDCIVVGGGLSNAWELFIDSTKREIELRALEGPKRNLILNRGELGDEAGIIGSAYLAFKKLKLINQL